MSYFHCGASKNRKKWICIGRKKFIRLDSQGKVFQKQKKKRRKKTDKQNNSSDIDNNNHVNSINSNDNNDNSSDYL